MERDKHADARRLWALLKSPQWLDGDKPTREEVAKLQKLLVKDKVEELDPKQRFEVEVARRAEES